MSALRVFHLIETLRSGGAEQLLSTTVRLLDRDAVTSTVGFLFEPATLWPDLRVAGATVHPLGLRGRFDWRRGVLTLARRLRAERIDVLHTHLFYAHLYGRLAARLAGVRAVVSTLHSLDYTYQDTGSVTFKLRKLVDRMTARHLTTRVVAVSRAVRDDYERHLGLRGVDVLYNYVDPGRYGAPSAAARREARARLVVDERTFVILNVGRLHGEKGLPYLIAAMPAVVAAVPGARLMLVGEGGEEATLRAQASAAGVAHAVTFAGERRDIREWLTAADVFVLPSRFEGLPISLLEALAMGIPAVGSAVGGIPEVIEDGESGLLVPYADAAALAGAITRLGRDPMLRDRLRAGGFAMVTGRFRAQDQVARLARIYAEVAGRPLGRRRPLTASVASW